MRIRTTAITITAMLSLFAAGSASATQATPEAPQVIDGVEISADLGIETVAELGAFLASSTPKKITMDVTTGSIAAVGPAATEQASPQIVQ